MRGILVGSRGLDPPFWKIPSTPSCPKQIVRELCPFNISTVALHSKSVEATRPATTWNKRTSVKKTGSSRAASRMAPRARKASSVGAKTVRPSVPRASTRPAAWTAAQRMENPSVPQATSAVDRSSGWVNGRKMETQKKVRILQRHSETNVANAEQRTDVLAVLGNSNVAEEWKSGNGGDNRRETHLV